MTQCPPPSIDALKVLHVVGGLTRATGVTDSVLSLLWALQSHGCCVRLYAQDGERDPVSDSMVRRFRTIRLGYGSLFAVSVPLAWALCREDYDVVHVHSPFELSTIVACEIGMLRRKVIVYTPHGALLPEALQGGRSWLKKIFIATLARRALRAAAVIHVTSEKERLGVERLFPGARVVVIPNPALGCVPADDIPGEVQGCRGEGDALRILYLGRIAAEKGLVTLVQAFRFVCEAYPKFRSLPKVELLIVGPPWKGHEREVDDCIRTNGLERSVHRLPAVHGSDRDRLLRSADIFIMPSYFENFGNAVVLAMAFGLPVLVTQGVGISDYVRELQAGLVVEHDSRSIADGLIRLIQDAELRRRLGRNGRHAATAFQPQLIASRMISLYKKLAREDRS